MSHIFISYSRQDAVCAYKIKRILEGQGFKIWIDKDDIPAGSPFPIQILEGIRTAAAVLILWSKQSAGSHFVSKEIEEALSQKMTRNLSVIPVWLDDTPLPSSLTNLNAHKVVDCAIGDIQRLATKLSAHRYRKSLPFDSNLPLSAQGATQLLQIPSLVALPIVESVYCKGRVIAPPNMSLNAAKTHKSKTIQVYLDFLGTAGDETALDKIYQHLLSTQPTTPFFMFHFTGHEQNGIYTLTDSPDDARHGDWLDPVNTVYSTILKQVGRGGATIQLFNGIPASLNFALGMQFYNFWHVQMYHYTRAKAYQFVLDTAELGS